MALEAARPGTVLCGKYRVERELARGGMGTVVVATHLKLGRAVAIKLLDTAGKDRAYVTARFLREARAAAGLNGEHVVRILDLDEASDGTPFLVMELLDGSDLEGLLLAEGKVAAPRAVDWALQACAALAEAHARGIVHRDVKPANLLLLKKLDGAELIKLLDFGISKLLSDEVQLTRTAATLGSPLFMSPEQLLTPGVVDTRSDVWSLGVTLYRLLSGVAPFDAADASTLAAQIAARPPTPLAQVAPALPAPLSAAVMRCLEKDPAQRWPSVLALADALEPFARPGGLGSARLVQLSAAQGQVALPRAPVAVPLAAEPRAAWTLSHDVPRAAAPPESARDEGSARGRSPSSLDSARDERSARNERSPARAEPVPAHLERSRGTRAAVAMVAVLGLVGAAVLLTWTPKHEPEPVGELAPRAVTARPVEAAPPVVAVAEPATQPSAEPARDAGSVARARPVKPANDPSKDPSDLELK